MCGWLIFGVICGETGAISKGERLMGGEKGRDLLKKHRIG